MKRLVELEESQKKSDSEECIISPKIVEKPSSSDEDTVPEGDSCNEIDTGENTLKVAIEEISSKKKKVEKETEKNESEETPSTGNVTIERHIIKIERDKVYTIISNKNQDICTDKSGDDKNSSKDTTKSVSSEEDCSVTGVKHENQALPLKNKQANEKGKANKNDSLIQGTENVNLDNKHNQRSVFLSEGDKNIIVSNINKNTSKSENTSKIVESKIDDGNKNVFLKIDKDISALKCEDTNTNDLKIDDTKKSALKNEDTNKSALKIEDTNKSAIKLEDTTNTSALKTQDIEKTVSTETQETVKCTLLTDESTLKIEYTNKSDSSKTESTEENSFKIEAETISALKIDTNTASSKIDPGECTLKNEAKDKCTLKNENIGECFVKGKDKIFYSKAARRGESPLLKNENLKNKDIDEISCLEDKDTKESISKNKISDENIVSIKEIVDESALKNPDTDKKNFSKNEDSDESAFLNVENTDLETVKTKLESNINSTVSDCPTNKLVVGQSERDLCSVNTKKEIKDVPNIVDQTQVKPDQQVAEVEANSGKLITDDSCEGKSKVSEKSIIDNPCQTSSSCKANAEPSPSSYQKVEPVPDSNIELVHSSSESFETNIVDTSSEYKLVSMESAVPYSLSDIQLPDSPSSIVKSAAKATSKKETLTPLPTNDSDKDSHSDNDIHRNGLNSGSKSRSKEKSVLDDTSNKRKMSVMESKKPDHKNTVSDIVGESTFLQKSKQSMNKKIIDSEEKTSRKKEKSFQSSDKRPESHTNSSSEESSGSSRSRKKRQPKSKISVEQSNIHKGRSRSSSSSSNSSQSEEGTPKKLPKEVFKNVKKKSPESDVPVTEIDKHIEEPKQISVTLKSKPRSSSPSRKNSSPSREESPVEPPKKDVTKSSVPDASRAAKKYRIDRNYERKDSKSRSRSPTASENKNSEKPSTESAKKSVEHDISKVEKKHHDESSLDEKTSKSKSRSSPSDHDSKSRKKSPLKQSEEDVKNQTVPDTSMIVRKRESSYDQKSSKSRSRSPTMASSRSSKSREKSPVKPSKQDIRLHDSDAHKLIRTRHTECSSDKNTSKSRSHSSSSSEEKSLIKPPKESLKKSSVYDASRDTRKHHPDSSSDHKTSESRSRSPSSSQSRERSPVKEERRKRIMDKFSKIDRKPVSSRKTSKSRSRSPSSNESEGESPLKRSRDNAKKSVVTEDSRTRKGHTESVSDRKTSKSRSRSTSSSRSSHSQEKRTRKSSKENVEKSVMSDTSKSGRTHQTGIDSNQKASRSRSRSSSSSPPPHKRRDVQISEEIAKDVTKSLTTDVKGAVDQKSDLPSDPPRKKLKINRNNVVISSLGSSEKLPVDEQKKISNKNFSEKRTEISPSSPKIEKERRESTSSTQPENIEREMGEIIENSPEVKYEPRKINFPGRKLSRKSSEDQTCSEPKSKKSKWGKFASSQKSSQAINISTDSLKNWFPEFKLVSEPSVVNDSIPEESPPIKDENKLSFPLKSEEELTKQFSTDISHQNNDEPLEATDSSGPISKIVFIQNLVRPFTLLQLKDLLRQTGNFIEDDFWIDKIKSKCFVTYTTEEEAIKTRNALNGVRWPSSNPKILSAEFSTEEEFEHHRSGKDAQKPVVERLPEVQETYDEKTSPPVGDNRRKDRDSDKRKERERYRPQAPVREWDKDKVLQDSPDREKSDKNIEGYRGSDKKDKKDTKKRANEDTPAKLLDDLFQKTKSIPCIYWLPLTEAQVLEHEESKRLRRLEREKRNQQREKEESEQRSKRSRLDHRTREVESRRSSTRSRSPTSRRR
ncbi:apoptotic chromatin condensation inducer in the nucleus isoform X2 [Parasteatoda tepidariorum]|nr:apoptotic chromatin condensation inducer in the nucleus isoform X2 [Parasteatoda tepidariorum]XP_042903209.1 apoptotic chromatin condensation inducer in the nucleus isoform X2 [Parasteatoda tepidariorum]